MTTIQALPLDMHRLIAANLPARELAAYGAVSQAFRKVAHQVADANPEMKKQLRVCFNVKNRKYRLRKCLQDPSSDNRHNGWQEANVGGYQFHIRNHVLYCESEYVLGQFISPQRIVGLSNSLVVQDGNTYYHLDFASPSAVQHKDDGIFSIAVTRFFRHCYRIISAVIACIAKHFFRVLAELKSFDPAVLAVTLFLSLIVLPIEITNTVVLTYRNKSEG